MILVIVGSVLILATVALAAAAAGYHRGISDGAHEILHLLSEGRKP